MAVIDRFVSLFGVPEFVVFHLDRFVSEGEMGLVVGLNGEKCSVSEIVARLNCSLEDAQVLLDACYDKHIVHREELDGELVYFGADFYELLDYVCKFDEGYPLIDKDLRKALDQWCYQVYAERNNSYLDSLINKEVVDRAPEAFLLIEDLDEVLESVSDIRVVPCNCRKLASHCAKPTETCLSFNDSITDRTFGRSLTKEEAKELVKAAHKKGLMHQVNSDWRIKGPTYICNCCSCCCYPLRLAQEKGTKGVFPVSQILVQRDDSKCSHCGACARRCNFGAFYVGEAEVIVKGKRRSKVEFDLTKCWGCGICEEACPAKAISVIAG
ncbi:ATP-binding protein [Desulfosporosinus lacus]|uniref:4Fe-4S dicluster domain-containing protein n=1 Tax=Desulfosporosinus lacus DSM 15449 TaxID=1121420 RepID=A0A1M5VHE7_9FIRM|nr:4Fe-4S binding protein [Desulfosporosinus lacus]SHH74595.1 4Fe-4S dicluster domain-containing protein [Desulfosporosinus lacus DSM 15449]